MAIHLPDQEWVDRTLREYGEDHPYVIAKVHAKFPKGGGGLAIPVTWVEEAQNSDDPTGPGWHRLCDLGLEGETAKHTVREGAWIRLGVDVAADGGDETPSPVRSATPSSSGTPPPASPTTTRSRSPPRSSRRSARRSAWPEP
ncbi:hypothetical protein LUR56_39860 [Streptomyces sp. MT29]|nr:hypothetical protein [Streptomyces sp. MT29]